MKLSAHEQRLIEFAHQRFGEHLTQFLLTGLGEEQMGQRLRFSITYAGGAEVLKRKLNIITHEPADGSTCLPHGRHPLVLIALLQLLLRGGHAPPNSLRYDQEDVLNLLGWKDTRKARGEIGEAIKRYCMLVYEWKMSRKELARNRLAFYDASEGLISEYNIVDEEVEESGWMRRVSNRVLFNENFIDRLLGRSLFDVVWDQVRSIELVSAPARRK